MNDEELRMKENGNKSGINLRIYYSLFIIHF
jgi:hypothetical protein